VPCRCDCFRYDAKNDIAKCPRGKILRPGEPIAHGRFFCARGKDCARCPLASLCLSKGRVNEAIVIGDDYPALLRAGAAAIAGLPKIGGSTSATIGARKASTARRRPGTVSPVPSDAVSTTCASRRC
jgi:hypothetical protein